MTPSQFREARKALRMTQAETAAACGISTRAITHYESGTRPVPGPVIAVLKFLAILREND